MNWGNYVKNHGSEETLVLSKTRRKAYAFLDWLYQDATIYLDRKYEKYSIAVKLRN